MTSDCILPVSVEESMNAPADAISAGCSRLSEVLYRPAAEGLLSRVIDQQEGESR